MDGYDKEKLKDGVRKISAANVRAIEHINARNPKKAVEELIEANNELVAFLRQILDRLPDSGY